MALVSMLFLKTSENTCENVENFSSEGANGASKLAKAPALLRENTCQEVSIFNYFTPTAKNGLDIRIKDGAKATSIGSKISLAIYISEHI